MEQTTVVLATLIVYKIVLIGIGIFASRGIVSEADYYLGDRGMGAWVTALSASSSSSSAWTLLGVSGAAYAWGIAAIWLFPACLGGFLINWFILAPRLMPHSRESGALTVTDIIAGPPGTPLRATIATLASLIVLFSFLFYVASQFQGSGKTFESTFNMSREVSIIVGAAIIMFYTMVGGFRAVSLTDALQGMVMVGTALILPVGALLAVGGFGALWSGMHEIATPGFASLTRGAGPIAGIGFVVGLMGIGLGYPGQPHVVNRFMALRDEAALNQGRIIAIGWAVVVYSGMILLGLSGRILLPELPDKEMVFLAVANDYFHPIIAGVMIAGVLSATMSTADSQLLVAASSISHDLPGVKSKNPVATSRVVVFLVSLGAALLALYGNAEIFSRVLFAWTAMGAAFGPLLLLRVFGYKMKQGWVLAAMLVGFVASVIAYSIPGTRGTWVERFLPFLAAFLIAWLGKARKQSG